MVYLQGAESGGPYTRQHRPQTLSPYLNMEVKNSADSDSFGSSGHGFGIEFPSIADFLDKSKDSTHGG
ncbi:MAG: hypothetical protein CVV27_20555 [Candidatus Melainabacteria bacterium HGW-Melainabacteria-1]|nr:MAG: hypothetical protein CVV27_20555 [Candidatus Melainabacteria bacterium HGW-Melainabacteria-1]